jgi:Uri superfamily endonuclease
MNGTYALVLARDEDATIRVGALGPISFQRGFYVYIGSAMSGIEQRVRRHLSAVRRIHWHIDYLLSAGTVVAVYCKESDRKQECALVLALARRGFEHVPGFGASDSPCASHLFFHRDVARLCTALEEEGMQRMR